MPCLQIGTIRGVFRALWATQTGHALSLHQGFYVDFTNNPLLIKRLFRIFILVKPNNPYMKKEESYTLIDTCRPWGFQELAICYFPYVKPRSASNQLRAWIRLSPLLMDQLRATLWRPGRKILTPRQVNLIVRHLGEP